MYLNIFTSDSIYTFIYKPASYFSIIKGILSLINCQVLPAKNDEINLMKLTLSESFQYAVLKRFTFSNYYSLTKFEVPSPGISVFFFFIKCFEHVQDSSVLV